MSAAFTVEDWKRHCDNCTREAIAQNTRLREANARLRAELVAIGKLVVERTGAEITACGGDADAWRPMDMRGLVEDCLHLVRCEYQPDGHGQCRLLHGHRGEHV